MFYYCGSLLSLPDISKWNTYKVENMSHMFDECISLISIPNVSKWNTNNLIYTARIFYNCISLLILSDYFISKYDEHEDYDFENFEVVGDIYLKSLIEKSDDSTSTL